MKLAIAILLACVAIPQACGFSFPSFENIGSNEALENIREAGKQIIEKAGRHVEKIRETVQKKKESLPEPSGKMREMWREMKEKAGEQQESWKERKGKMKEMWKDLKQKAGEHKEELKKKWQENKESWRNQTEEKWLKLRSLVAEHLQEAKVGIDGLEEKLAAKIPEKPWKAMKEMRWRAKDLTDKIIALKEVFKMKLRELKPEDLEPITEGEEQPEVPEEPYTEDPYTDEPEPTTPYTPEEIPYIPEEIPDEVVPSEIPWTPAPEPLSTAYPEEDLDGDENWSSVDQEVLSDEEESEEESPEEEDGEEEEEEEEFPEEQVEEEGDEDEEEGDNDEEEKEEEEEGYGAVEGEAIAQTTQKKSPMKLFSKIMSERRNRMKQWFKKRKQHVLRNLFKKTRVEENPEREE